MATYRLFGSATVPTTTAGEAGVSVNIGLEFYVTQTCWATKALHWVPLTGGDMTSAFQAGIYRVDTAVTGTLMGSQVGIAGSGGSSGVWREVVFTTAVQLIANQRYRIVVRHPDARYAASPEYFTADITNGPLIAPSTANAMGNIQASYNYSPGLAFTNNSSARTNYWVDVEVSDVDPNSGNIQPTAHAGTTQNVPTGTLVTLAGSGTDIDGTISGYQWRQISGASVTLSSLSAQSPTFTAPSSAATLTFGLRVTDNGGLQSNESTVVITADASLRARVRVNGAWQWRFVRVRQGGVWVTPTLGVPGTPPPAGGGGAIAPNTIPSGAGAVGFLGNQGTLITASTSTPPLGIDWSAAGTYFTITSSTSRTFENYRFTQPIKLEGGNTGTTLTFKNCLFQISGSNQYGGLTHQTSAPSNLLIVEDCTFTSTALNGLYGNGHIHGDWPVQIRRCDISGRSDGIQKGGSNATIEQNYIHSPALFGTYPNNTHNDGMQFYGGTNLIVRYNRVDIGWDGEHQNGALFYQGIFTGPVISNNFISGGGITLRLESGVSGAVVTNNIIKIPVIVNPPYGPATHAVQGTVAQWTGNVLNTGQAVTL